MDLIFPYTRLCPVIKDILCTAVLFKVIQVVKVTCQEDISPRTVLCQVMHVMAVTVGRPRAFHRYFPTAVMNVIVHRAKVYHKYIVHSIVMCQMILV